MRTPKLLTRRSLLVAAPAVLLVRPALAQVGQIPGWPPAKFVSAGGGSFALKSHTAAGSSDGNGFTTTAINTVGANFIAIALAWYNGVGSTVSISDNQSNGAPTALTTVTSGTLSCRIFYYYSPITNASHTFTITGSNILNPSLFVAAFSGASASPFDQQGSGTGAGATSVSDSSPVTPTVSNELVLSFVGGAGVSSGYAIDSGFTIIDTIVGVGSQHEGGSLAYLKQTTAAAVQPTWSWTGSQVCATTLGTFKFA